MNFQLERPEQYLTCHDCGFVFAETPKLDLSEPEECIFCGSRRFYFEAPLDLSFLGLASICYVCEARYKGVVIDTPEEKYTETGARSAGKSEAALNWKKRVEWHNREARHNHSRAK